MACLQVGWQWRRWVLFTAESGSAPQVAAKINRENDCKSRIRHSAAIYSATETEGKLYEHTCGDVIPSCIAQQPQ